MTKTNARKSWPSLGKASRVTRGAYGHMIEVAGLWDRMGLSRD